MLSSSPACSSALGLLAAPAQAQTGSARGKVLDEQGQPIPDAKVLIEFQGGITRKFETKTNKKGEYMQVGMQPGPYRFTASKEGYQPAVSDVRIALGDPTPIPDFKLATRRPRPRRPAGQRRVGAARPVREGRRAPERREARRGGGRVQGHPREGAGRPRGLPEPRRPSTR